MDWAKAIERNSEVLKGIIDALFAMLGLDGGDATERIPQYLHRTVLRVLVPAESAVHRLIVMAARGLVVKAVPSRPMPKGQMIGKGGAGGLPSFRLYDTRKYFPELCQRRVKYAKSPPRILFFGPDSRIDDLWARPVAAPPPPSDGLVNAQCISRRLQVLKLALEDLPRQAKRLARWRIRRENAKALKFKSPLRPGRPPGHRKRHIHPIDEILADCHWLAWEAERPDAS